MDIRYFKALDDSMNFQKLCLELLIAEGCKNVYGLGSGADQGSDIFAEIPFESPLDINIKKFIVQCKWYGPTKTVSENEIGDVIGYLDLHDADGLLIITSSKFSGTAISKADAINRNKRHPYQIKLWDGDELSRRLRKYPDIISRYWYGSVSESDDKKQNKQLPPYDEDKLLKEHSVPKAFMDATIESFPVNDKNKKHVDELKNFAIEFDSNPPPITLVDGAVGAGKTGFVWALLNNKIKNGYKAVEISSTILIYIFFRYEFNNDYTLVAYIKFFQEVEYLAIDDFGLFLPEKSDTQIKYAKFLTKIVKDRKTLNKPTILIVNLKDNFGPTLDTYLKYLEITERVIYVGDYDLRLYNREQTKNLFGIKDDLNQDNDKPYIYSTLGKSWLIEKKNKTFYFLDSVIKILLTPSEEFEANQKLLKEMYGVYETKEQELLEKLYNIKFFITKYYGFLESIDFEVIFFYTDGSVEIRFESGNVS